MQSREFDLLVIGTGSAGTSVAYPCRSAGWSVAIVDDRPFGGTCATRGCDPKKVLVGIADAVDRARRLTGKGVDARDLSVNWADLMRFKDTFTDPVPAKWEKNLSEAGIEMFHGLARFTSPDTMSVGETTIRAKHIVLASGAQPVPLGIPGGQLAITSDDFLELKELPQSLIFVGGGYIAFEFAHLAHRAGAKVTILHRGKRPLEQFDGDLTDKLVNWSRRIGIEVHLEAAVESIERTSAGFNVQAAGGRSFPGACVVHAAGRVPLLERMDVHTGGVQVTKKGVAVNQFLQSVSNPVVYAAGDAADSGGPPLTPVAGYEGRTVTHNLLGGNSMQTDYRGVTSVAFTLPPLASVGLTSESARQQGIEFEEKSGDMNSWYSSRRIAEECSAFKVLTEKGTGRLLGAHLLADHADEIINVFALAIRAGLPASELKGTLFGYPTLGSNIQYML